MPELGLFPGVVTERLERNILYLIPRHAEERIECPVGRLNPQLCVQNHQRTHRVEDRFCILSFVDGLLEAGPKRRNVRKSQDRSLRRTSGLRIRGDANDKTAISNCYVASNGRFVPDDLCAKLFKILKVTERSNRTWDTANIG